MAAKTAINAKNLEALASGTTAVKALRLGAAGSHRSICTASLENWITTLIEPALGRDWN